jgi:alpha-N-arabinofuranosidase
MFIEHIGGLIQRGIWAEMLDDRKFFFPVTSQSPARPQNRRAQTQRWVPIGPDDAVVMDSAAAYAGTWAPRITLAGPAERGIAQSGLVLRPGKAYTGHVVIAGDPGAAVVVRLVWGPGAADRQTVAVRPLRTTYATFPFRFVAGASTDSGRFEIAGTGRSGRDAFRVGAVSLMPADNVEGFRSEIIAGLKQLRSGIWRFPGGNFVSGHEWRDAIGDRDRRPPRWDPAWRVPQENDVGIDEFMTFCRLIGVEADYAVNSGFGDAWSAAQAVEYANGPVTTPMGRLRAANGHPAPYHIRWWSIGNEMWGGWSMGVMPLDQYVIKHNLFAEAMRKVDPTIKLIGSGQALEGMTMSGSAKRITGKTIAEYDSPADWSGGMLRGARQNMDLISEHYYVYSSRHYDLAKGEQVAADPNQPLEDWLRMPANLVRVKYEEYQEYFKRIPGLKEHPVPISLDEWAYTGTNPNGYKVALAYAWALQEMFRHSELYQMGGFTMGTATLSSRPGEAVLNATGMMFKLYRDHFGTIPVAVDGRSPPPAQKNPVGGDQPAVNAGSDTYPLDVAAALSPDRKALTIAVVNPTLEAHDLALTVTGATLARAGAGAGAGAVRAAPGPGANAASAGGVRLWRMAPASVDATVVVGQKPGVELEEVNVGTLPATLTIPPFSMGIYLVPLQ